MTSSDDRIKDRRANGRIPVGFPVEMRDISFQFRGVAVDLSPAGVRVRVTGAPPLVNTDLELTLRPEGEPPVKLKGRVMHGLRGTAGVAFAVGEPEVFEAGLGLYETLVMRDPKLAIRLKQRPTTLEISQRIWPLPLKDARLSGQEQWVWAKLSPEGSPLLDLKRTFGAEWPKLTHVPFALLERNLAALTQPPMMADEEPAPAKTTGSRLAIINPARKPPGPAKNS